MHMTILSYTESTAEVRSPKLSSVFNSEIGDHLGKASIVSNQRPVCQTNQSLLCPVSWSCRTHRLLLCKEVSDKTHQ